MGSRSCRGRVRSRSARWAAWSRSGRQRRILRGSRPSDRILVATTMSSTSWVVSPVTVSMSESGAGTATVDRQMVVEAAVDLELRDRADAEAQAEGRHAQQIALAARRPDTPRSWDEVDARLRRASVRRRSARDPRSTSGRCCAAAGRATARRPQARPARANRESHGWARRSSCRGMKRDRRARGAGVDGSAGAAPRNCRWHRRAQFGRRIRAACRAGDAARRCRAPSASTA